jgi:hypothetical protein
VVACTSVDEAVEGSLDAGDTRCQDNFRMKGNTYTHLVLNFFLYAAQVFVK